MIKLTAKQKLLKNKLISILFKRNKLMITELHKLLPEIKGVYTIYMPVKPDINPNIIWFAGVSQDFIRVFDVLLNVDKSIGWDPEHILTYIFFNAPIYKHKQLSSSKQLKGNTELWLPISISIKHNILNKLKK